MSGLFNVEDFENSISWVDDKLNKIHYHLTNDIIDWLEGLIEQGESEKAVELAAKYGTPSDMIEKLRTWKKEDGGVLLEDIANFMTGVILPI